VGCKVLTDDEKRSCYVLVCMLTCIVLLYAHLCRTVVCYLYCTGVCSPV